MTGTTIRLKNKQASSQVSSTGMRAGQGEGIVTIRCRGESLVPSSSRKRVKKGRLTVISISFKTNK